MSKQRYFELYGKYPSAVYASPGRVELCGNHTDHQGGKVLAAAIDRAVRIYADGNASDTILVHSDGFPPCAVNRKDLSVHIEEKNTTAALIRGICAGLQRRGTAPVGAELLVTSDVPVGSGLSSSAAFSVAMAKCLSDLAGASLTKEELAQLAQFAENRYFFKPCGGLDQYASALGGAVSLDFSVPEAPKAETLSLDFLDETYALCIVQVGADHTDLTEEYADIVAELKDVAAFFGRERLIEVEEAQINGAVLPLRRRCGDRAVLRALHVFAENRRVDAARAAIQKQDAAAFAEALRASGHSSRVLLQNIVPSGAKREQSAALALALAERELSGTGAARIHGGGFGGTILCLVPKEIFPIFQQTMESVFGPDSVLLVRADALGVRKEG